MSRREFPKPVKAEIVRRALHPKLGIVCEGCGLALGKKPFNIDHTIMDALFLDKTRKLTAADGKLLGKECCHDPKTHEVDIPTIAKAKRVEANYLGIKSERPKMQSAPFPHFDKPKRGVSKDSLPPLPRAKLYEERT